MNATMDPLQPAQGWAGAVAQRLATPAPRQRSLALRCLSFMSSWMGRPQMPDLFPVLGIHRGLFFPWLRFASRLMPFGALPSTTREMLILRTGWNCRCRYEWGQHVDMALGCGLSDQDILRIADGPQAFSDPIHRTLMQACDDLCARQVISDAVWQSLRRHWDEPELIEITMLVGHYQMLAGFINTAGLVLEPSTETKLQAFHQRAMPAALPRAS
ncbi:MAG: carboxymuconolactone decarboxylase family protein [Rubrivivax sp.]|nr:MAG: carboxymuconolactone decarboxylase family protein [Rubrivivax sp.]